MTRFAKNLARLLARPRDFTWNELQVIMAHFGYEELKGSGSKRKFFSPKSKAILSLHEPHPKPILKRYIINIVIKHLRDEGLI